jgi:hypothetical protein
MNAIRPIGAALVAAALAAAAGAPAFAQSNLDAGKSPAKLFAQGCSACHSTPHDLAVVRRDFLIQHYTTGPEQADLLAAYLEAVRNEPDRKPRRSPRAETETADVAITGSIGVAMPAVELPESSPHETAARAASEPSPEPAVAVTVIPTLVPLPPPLDIDE